MKRSYDSYQPLTSNDPLVWGLVFYEVNGGLDLKSAVTTNEVCPLFYDMSINTEITNGYWKNKVIELFDIYKDEYVNKANVVWKELYISYTDRIQKIADRAEVFLDGGSQSGLELLEPLKDYLLKPNANSKAQFCYAYYLPSGKRALNYFKFSADNGNIKAMHKLAILCELGDGTAQNNEEALKYYKLIRQTQTDAYEAFSNVKDEHVKNMALLKYTIFFNKHKKIFGEADVGIFRCNSKILNQKK